MNGFANYVQNKTATIAEVNNVKLLMLDIMASWTHPEVVTTQFIFTEGPQN